MAFKLFSKRADIAETKSTIPLGVVGFTGPQMAQWSGRNPVALTRSGYLNNPIGFRCVKLIVEAATSIEFVVQDAETRYEDHPILRLLRQPNLNQAGPVFFQSLYEQILLSGNGYVEAVCDEAGTIYALHSLRADRMKVIPGADGWPQAYEYSVGKSKTRYALDREFPQILHIKTQHPHDDHYGLSPLMAAASAVDVHNAASQWSKALLDNAARPSGAIVYKGRSGDGTMSEAQYDRLVEEIECNHQGARNAGRPMLLEGGLDWKPMGFSPSDMEFHRTKEAAAREISLALGVPPMLLGLPGDNTYANYQEANRAFFRLTVLPFVQLVSKALAGWFARALGAEDAVEINIDLDKIPALALEREADWRRIAEAGFLSENEKRKLLGFPPIEEG